MAENYLTRHLPMESLSLEQRNKFIETQINCSLCKKLLNSDINFHHCHVCGRFLSLAHSSCNFEAQKANYITVLFHNLAYDIHFLKLPLLKCEGKVEVIAHNKEKFISVFKTIKLSSGKFFQIRFLDTFKFLPSSLENLSPSLKIDNFETIKKELPLEHLHLIIEKQKYPYEKCKNIEDYFLEEIPQI